MLLKQHIQTWSQTLLLLLDIPAGITTDSYKGEPTFDQYTRYYGTPLFMDTEIAAALEGENMLATSYCTAVLMSLTLSLTLIFMYPCMTATGIWVAVCLSGATWRHVMGALLSSCVTVHPCLLYQLRCE